MNQKTTGVFRIKSPKIQKPKTLGYLNLIDRKKVETNKKGTPKKYRSRASLIIGIALKKASEQLKKSKIIALSIIEAGRLEANILTAKFNFKRALRSIYDSYYIAKCRLDIYRAEKHLRDFKISCNSIVKSLVF